MILVLMTNQKKKISTSAIKRPKTKLIMSIRRFFIVRSLGIGYAFMVIVKVVV